MTTLILYATKHGCTKKAAAMLEKRLPPPVTVQPIERSGEIDLEDFDTVIIGGSIHAGRLQSKLQRYCEQNAQALEKKRLGLYLCCMFEGPKRQTQLEEAFAERLRARACCIGLFGGELLFEKMSFIERAIVKKVAKVSQNVSKFDEQAVEAFARDMTRGC